MTDDVAHLREIAGITATRLDLEIGRRSVCLWAVPDLEGLVDRGALLRGEAEPPYWAYLWSGARVLASYLERFVDVRGLRVLEIGCGLALPGITAAILGADVTLVDLAAPALAFADASAAANDVACTQVVSDFTCIDPGLQFDVVLAAEIAYDRARYGELAAVFVRHVRPGGFALLADGYRTDTRGLYAALATAGFAAHAYDLRIDEEGRPMPVRLTLLSSRDTAPRPA